MKRFRFNSFGTQLLLWFLILTIVLLVGITTMSYRYTAQQIDHRVGEAAQRNVSQAMENLSLLTRGYDSLTKSIIANTEIQRMLSKEEVDPNNEYRKQLSMISVLGSIFYSYSDLKAVHIISNSGRIYSYALLNSSINKEFLNSEWFEQLKNSDGNLVWGGMLEQPPTVSEGQVFTFGRTLTELFTTKRLGVIVVEADPKAMISSMNNLSFGSGSNTIVYSRQGTPLIWSGFDDASLPEMSDMLAESYSTLSEEPIDISNSDHLKITILEPDLGWRLINSTPKSLMLGERVEANRYFFMMTCIAILAAFIFATLLSRSISRPIQTIVKEMMRIERGDLSAKLNTIKSYDEINYLNVRFNRMIGEINQLVERIKIKTISEKNAQIYAMQSHINPHFLYNTLGMIYWLLEEEQNKQLADIVLSLSHMYRYSSDWRTSLVPLKKELEQINHYMNIVVARLDGRIQLKNVIEDKWLESLIPKMTLQPIIENAVVHGLAEHSQDGLVKITASVKDQRWCINITDNGKGIATSKLHQLQDALARVELLEWEQFTEEEDIGLLSDLSPSSNASSTGMGLLSVHRRLVLEFGTGFGLRIQSEENVFTMVSIVMPLAQADNLGIKGGVKNEHSRSR